MLRLLNHFKAGSAYLLIVWISFVVPTPASAEFSQEVLEIQQGLERLGYDSRPFDGLWGAVTQSAVDEFCEDQSLQCGGLEFPAVLNFIHEGISELPETEINRLLALRQTINPFLAWNRSDLALMRGDYGLHWGLTPGPGENTIRLNEIFWHYFYPNKPWLNYPGIDQYLTDRNWGHAAEYGLTLATNINSGEFLEYISGIALHRMNASSSHGVMLDWWHDYHSGGFSRAEVRRARLSFASMLRETLGDDAIILGNVSWLREVASLRYLNGVFLELSKEPYLERRPTLYTRDELYRVEDLLIYYERNLSYPRLIALEGWRQTTALTDADRNTPANRRMAKIVMPL